MQLFFYFISTQHRSSVPRFVFIAAKKKKKIDEKNNTLHPFSNVENVVQMFLIVIIKAKSGYIKCGLLLIALLRQGINKNYKDGFESLK